MEIALAVPGLAFAAFCAGVMGFAIQRGATCTVAAVDEVISKRRVQRLLAILEASAWVAGGLLIAQAIGLLRAMPAGYPLSGWTVLGGALLGLGAYINRACVFGAIARLGSGEWAYAATPVGFFLGCVSFGWVFPDFATPPLHEGSLVLRAPEWIAVPVAALMAWRIARPAFAASTPGGWHRELARRVWAPHAATTVIAIAFLVLLLLAGPWTYIETLAELARGMAHSLPVRGALLLALLLGAVLGGWTAGRLASTRVTAGQLIRCTGGGMIMAWGGLMVPGSNDGLILLGLPLLFAYAWVAFLVMGVSIAAARLAAGRWMEQRAAPGVAAAAADTETASRGCRHGRT